jgi:hypothetical protein
VEICVICGKKIIAQIELEQKKAPVVKLMLLI